MAEYLYDFEGCKDFLNMTQKALRGKSDKSDYIKFKNFCSFKDVIILEREATKWENIFFSQFESRMYGGIQNHKKKKDKRNK